MPQMDLLALLPAHRGSVYALAAGSNGKFFSAGSDGVLLCWQWPQQRPLILAQVPSQVFALWYDAVTHHLLAGTMSGAVYVTEVATGRILAALQHHTDSVFHIRRFGTRIYLCSKDGTVSCLDPEHDYQLLQRWRISAQAVRRLAFHPQLPCAAGSSDSHIYLLDASSGSISACLTGPVSSVFCLAYDGEGHRLFAGSRDARLYVYAMPAGTLIYKINAHMFTLNDLMLIGRDQWLVTASRDKSIRLWKADDLTLLFSFSAEKNQGHTHSVNALLWLEPQQLLISGSDDRRIGIWKIAWH